MAAYVDRGLSSAVTVMEVPAQTEPFDREHSLAAMLIAAPSTTDQGPHTMPSDLTLRRYELVYEGHNQTTGTLEIRPRITRTIDAAYWCEEGDDPHKFITFKDVHHKPVFSVRRSMVESIEELRVAQKPPAFSDIIDADPYKTETGTAWDEGKILRGVMRGRLAIDSARVLLGYEPFHLPETLHAFTYTQCPNGCDNGAARGLHKPDGPSGSACSDCPM